MLLYFRYGCYSSIVPIVSAMMMIQYPFVRWIPMIWVNGATPSHQPLCDGVFPYKLTSYQLLGIPHGYGNPIAAPVPWRGRSTIDLGHGGGAWTQTPRGHA